MCPLVTESNAELWSQIAGFKSQLHYQLSSVALGKVLSLLVPPFPSVRVEVILY